MGTKRDKRRKKKGRVASGAKKTETKSEKNEEKKTRRVQAKLAKDEDDIDALLAAIELQEAQRVKVEIQEDCKPPPPRVHASYTPVQLEPHRVPTTIVFGGEFENSTTGRVMMYNDLHKYNHDKNQWTRIICPHSPKPRSSHQIVEHKGFLYLFGGEFTSPKQDRFHHHGDFWRFDLSTNEWDRLPVKGGPQARSGHRMVLHKNTIILFGGFTDTGRDKVRYYNDIWTMSLGELTWVSVGDINAHGPSPRGGSRLEVFENHLYLYGGYSLLTDKDDVDMEHGIVHDDLWILDLESYKWNKIKKNGMAPGPRSGFCLAKHKRRAIIFGGVRDNEAKGGETLVSEFFNELYQFNFDNKRWFPVVLRPPKGSKNIEDEGSSDHSSKPREATQSLSGSELKATQAAVRIQSRYRGYVVRKAYKLYKIGGVVSEILYSPAAYGIDLSSLNLPKPRGRINAGMVVLKNTLWLFGGIVEVMDKEIALDDIWKLDLNKYDGWNCVQENSVGEEAFRECKDHDSSSSQTSDSGSDSGTD